MTKLIDIPDYTYTRGQVACPECYKPVDRNRRDGRCQECLHNKQVLPINYLRRPRKKQDDEDEYSSYERDEYDTDSRRFDSRR